MAEQTLEQEVSLEQSGYDAGVSLRVELQTLKTELTGVRDQLRESVSLQRALLTKLQEQHVMLGSIAKFVKDNGTDAPSFGVGR